MRVRAPAAIGILGFALGLGLAPLAQGATRYDPERSGHPLRIAAYALHPVGVILDRLIFHPAWSLGQHEPLRTLFGVAPDPLSASTARAATAAPSSPPDSIEKR